MKKMTYQKFVKVKEILELKKNSRHKNNNVYRYLNKNNEIKRVIKFKIRT